MISGTDEPSEGSARDRLVVEGGIEDQASEELPVLSHVLGCSDPTGPMSRAHVEIAHQTRRLGQLLDEIDRSDPTRLISPSCARSCMGYTRSSSCTRPKRTRAISLWATDPERPLSPWHRHERPPTCERSAHFSAGPDGKVAILHRPRDATTASTDGRVHPGEAG